jgi:hypothetical protein
VASFVRDIKTLGISHREMDFIQGLRWSLEEVSRTFGVPKPLLSDLERATFSNVNAAERFFWRNTMVPEMRFIANQITRNLFPALGYQGLEMEFDLTTIEALSEDESTRVSREVQLLDRGVLTINEVRRSRNLTENGKYISKRPAGIGDDTGWPLSFNPQPKLCTSPAAGHIPSPQSLVSPINIFYTYLLAQLRRPQGLR